MAEVPRAQGSFAHLLQPGRSRPDLGRAVEGTPSPTEAPTPMMPDDPSTPLLLSAGEAHSEDAQLLTQYTPGWHVPHPSRLPGPTYAPVMTAFGIVFIALGAVTVWPLSVVGAVIFVLAIAKWIGELLHD